MKDSNAPLFVVTPRREELGGNLVAFVADHFSNKSELSLGNLIPDRGNIKKFVRT